MKRKRKKLKTIRVRKPPVTHRRKLQRRAQRGKRKPARRRMLSVRHAVSAAVPTERHPESAVPQLSAESLPILASVADTPNVAASQTAQPFEPVTPAVEAVSAPATVAETVATDQTDTSSPAVSDARPPEINSAFAIAPVTPDEDSNPTMDIQDTTDFDEHSDNRTPTPAHVVWVSEINDVLETPPDALPIVPSEPENSDVAPAALTTVGVTPQPLSDDDASVAEVRPAILEEPEIPLHTVVPPQVTEITAPDLFDAAGNLTLPPKIQTRAAFTPNLAVTPVPPEPTTETPAVASDPFAPEAAETLSRMPPVQRKKRLDGVTGLSVTGAVRLAFWPVKFIYWPCRLFALRRQRRAYERQYAKQAAPIVETPLSNLARLALQFIVVCVVLLLPLQIAVYLQDLNDAQDHLLAQSGMAIGELRLGRDELKALRLMSAAEHFQRAQDSFLAANKEYRRLNFFTKAILKTTPHGQRALTAGLSLLTAGESLASVGSEFSTRAATVTRDGVGENLPEVLNMLNDYTDSMMGLLPKVAQARTALDRLDLTHDPLGNREGFLTAANALPELEETLKDSTAISRSILQLLGKGQWRRYLVLFENNAELRATGGFVGSFALMDVQDGKIINLEVPGGGTYDLQGRLMALVNSPAPLHLVNPRWEMQDANWWPDFPTSAKKTAWFLEQSRGGSVDGVIALTNTLVERILAVTGPIELPSYGRVISAENFVTETQNLVEIDYDRTENRPKQFLADLAPRLIERMLELDPVKQQALLTVLYEAIREKHLMMYSADPQTQEILASLDWAGQQQPVGLSDYLMVVTTNVLGGKSDRVVETNLRHAVTVGEDGKMTVSLMITKTHRGQADDPFTGLPNRSYLRVYVPAGSTLISATGFAPPDPSLEKAPDGVFTDDADLLAIEGQHEIDAASGVEIYAELGKTVFAHWLTVAPGEQRSATLTYQLPFTLDEANGSYTLLAQKQAGTAGDELLATLHFPVTNQVARAYPQIGDERMQQLGNVIQFHDRLTTDKFYGIVFTPAGAAADNRAP
ncbi:MAG: DUF4012 domain-containing protein [Patescibacteria group bacterium]|nr:DUF4012 domain-containing protein [Patescibacteria group bacterium]